MVFVGGWWSSLVVVAVERLELLESVSRSRERLATLCVRDRHHMASGSVSRDTIVSRYNRVTTSVVHVYQASRVISNGVDKHRCHHDLVVVGFAILGVQRSIRWRRPLTGNSKGCVRSRDRPRMFRDRPRMFHESFVTGQH